MYQLYIYNNAILYNVIFYLLILNIMTYYYDYVSDLININNRFIYLYLKSLNYCDKKLTAKLITNTHSNVKSIFYLMLQPHIFNFFSNYDKLCNDRGQPKKWTDEQASYIINPHITDTILLACAGSGKTTSIKDRIKFLYQNKMFDREEIYYITFSRNTKDDVVKKIMNTGDDHEKYFFVKNILTIDSLAKKILYKTNSSLKTNSVEILSVSLRDYLSRLEGNSDEIAKFKQYFPISCLFVDEAQDLTKVQYDILLCIKKYLKTCINLVGDPNQNIYQFRCSSSKYLLNHVGLEFNFSTNFRSTRQIIEFCDCIKPIKLFETKALVGSEGEKPMLISDSFDNVLNFIVKFIRSYPADLSNIAIVSPIRGSDKNNKKGISVIYNKLLLENIMVCQRYNESSDKAGSIISTKINSYDNCVNLLTYHGTKGLEFDVVFVMDFYQSLFNNNTTFTDDENNRYLMYVATSRAKTKLFVCTYTNNDLGYFNNVVQQIDSNKYTVYNNDSNIRISQRKHKENKIRTVGITDLITNNMHDTDIYEINKILKIKKTKEKIYKDHQKVINRADDQALFGIFCENYFCMTYNLLNKKKLKQYKIIENICCDSILYVPDSEYKILTKVSQCKSWSDYYLIKKFLSSYEINIIENYYDRRNDFDTITFVSTFFKNIIEDNKCDIIVAYSNYIGQTDAKYNESAINDLYYIILVMYCIKNNHIIHLYNNGQSKKNVIDNGKLLFVAIYNYLYSNIGVNNYEFSVAVSYCKLSIIGEIDILEKQSYNVNGSENKSESTIIDIKCSSDIKILYYLQLFLYGLCLNYQNNREKIYDNNYKIINLLTGNIYNINISVDKSDLYGLLCKLCCAGNLYFENLSLVYDLETTGLISKNNYPEIIEICIKDYETDMIIINELIKPKNKISERITEITGITNAMVSNKNPLDKLIITNRLSYIKNCNLISYNGRRFDDILVNHYKIFPLDTKITYIDAMNILPDLVKNNKITIDNKKQSHIYNKIFGTDYNCHRAESDVDALIKIFRRFKINL
jgi:hypothetical protein